MVMSEDRYLHLAEGFTSLLEDSDINYTSNFNSVDKIFNLQIKQDDLSVSLTFRKFNILLELNGNSNTLILEFGIDDIHTPIDLLDKLRSLFLS